MTETSPWGKARPDAELDDKREAPPASQTEFAGRRRSVFWMALKLGVLTVLTLGFYRFWMKTRLRRWYWSAWRPLGTPLEYVGDPWEKLLGFLIAVVILAFYIGVVNLLLMFASFSLFQSNFAAYLLSFLGVIPLWFFARYRARRYVLARTRWRGIRFGLMPGAWGYAVRALWHWVLTLLTLGLLWPRKAFYLEQYITDRTYFGDQALVQTGRWQALMRAWLVVWMPVVIGAGHIVLTVAEVVPDITALVWVGVVPTALWGIVNYYAKTLGYLTSHKEIAGARLHLKPRPWRIARIYAGGYFLVFIMASILAIPLFVLGIVSALSMGLEVEADFGALQTIPETVLSALAIISYFLLFVMWAAFTHAFVRFPLFRHFAETFEIRNSAVIETISQRPRDEFGEAEGFAEALDVGAAI